MKDGGCKNLDFSELGLPKRFRYGMMDIRNYFGFRLLFHSDAKNFSSKVTWYLRMNGIVFQIAIDKSNLVLRGNSP
ncbi:hypothetical protein Nepgr_020914 [Nepenthes gracilis]|uniref:Uncharacterized protein n=1 Tax=Nepenthes gracilis TaxID=150966 RepID=A0AAD3SX15_NEPGR|nr:hypothetical protein Nepgr_020914 [Nepenthes gracilis]